MVSRFVRASWLAASVPLASAAIYYAWLKADSAGFDPCGALSLNYGFVPFFLLPAPIVAMRARAAGRSRPAVIGFAVATIVFTAFLIAGLWLGAFGGSHCGE
jgi:hypothetical protein